MRINLANAGYRTYLVVRINKRNRSCLEIDRKKTGMPYDREGQQPFFPLT